MKYLALLLLLITSCTDKNQITEPIVIEPEPIIEEVIEPEPVKLSYDKGLDLMLVSTSFEDTWDNILDKREEGLGYLYIGTLITICIILLLIIIHFFTLFLFLILILFIHLMKKNNMNLFFILL